jgi:hypothetical protein
MPDVVSNDELNALAAEYVLGTLDYEERKGATALLEVDHAFRGIVRIWERRLGELHLMVEAVDPDAKLWERIKGKAAGVAQVATSETALPAAVTEDVPAAVGEGDAPPAAAVEPAGTAAELKLAELAALLPVSADQPGTAAVATPPPAFPVTVIDEPKERPAEIDEPKERPAEEIPRGFVPPAPMIRRSSPAAQPEVASPRAKAGRGWMVTALLTGLIAIALAGLIGAWRFFPERLPEPLRAKTVLKTAPQAQPAPSKPMPFNE